MTIEIRTSIAELNASHPLNQLCLECLVGWYPLSEDDELAALTLMRAWWDELEQSRLFHAKGMPQPEEVASVINFLSVADPQCVMSYLTVIGGRNMLEIDKCEELDGDQIAREVLAILVSQLVHGTPLPEKLRSEW